MEAYKIHVERDGLYRVGYASFAAVGLAPVPFADLKLEDKSKVFNTEIVAALELQNMVEVAESLAVSAASRNESRGAHTRRDEH